MYNLLLMGDNYNTIKQICNSIISKIENIKIIGITIDFNELCSLISETKSEIIIICNTNYDTLPLLKISNYTPLIIIISDYKTKIKKFKNKILISNKVSSKYILNQIESCIENRNVEFVRQEVVDILKYLKFDFKFLGTHYLLDCIVYSYLHRDSYEFENLEKKVYPYIATKNKTSAGNVKWAIIRSINNMYLNHTTQTFHIIEDYFCISFPEKPTNKLIIGMIVNKLKKRKSSLLKNKICFMVSLY